MNALTVTPTAIDAFVAIESIRVVGRHRKELGDLTGLKASIEDVDLLNPVTLDREGRLVAGGRRLEACRQLGWDTIPVRFIDSLADAAKLLRAERDENTERKEMLLSEKASLGAALEELESQGAKARQQEAQGRGRATRYGLDSGAGAGIQQPQDSGHETRNAVGEALGMSGRTYTDLAYVHRLATGEDSSDFERDLAAAALTDMDRTGSVKPAADRVRGALRARRDAQEAKAAALADPEPGPQSTTEDPSWIPAGGDSSPRAVSRRRDLIREMADEGLSSHQISDRIGILAESVRRIARADGIRLPADEAMGRGTRKRIDSNRIVRETVAQFAGLEMSLRLINFDDLDQSEIKDWTVSLTDSIRLLNRLNRRLKEMAQ
jgi:ParB-like chromosome segregation protein Spo0J